MFALSKPETPCGLHLGIFARTPTDPEGSSPESAFGEEGPKARASALNPRGGRDHNETGCGPTDVQPIVVPS